MSTSISNWVQCDIDCRRCGTTHTLSLVPQDLYDWTHRRKLIQDAMPYLSAGERELLMSELCDDCWQFVFGGDDSSEVFE